MMKKAIKKLLAALLAVAMLCAMAVPALATDEAAGADTHHNSSSANGTITINNAINNTEYKIYRILDLQYNEATKSYRYVTNNTWSAFVADKSDYLTVESTGNVTWKDGADIATFAQLAGQHAKDNASTVSPVGKKFGNNSTVEFTGLPLGWYLVVSGLTNDAICSIDTTDPSVEISEKNGKPTIHKFVYEGTTGEYSNDAGIGDTVKFVINVAVLDGTPTGYVIHDAMSAGLSFNEDSVTVKRYRPTAENPLAFDVLTKGTNYTVTKNPAACAASEKISGCTFEVKLEDSALQANDMIMVEYTATVNANAVIGGAGNPNETILKYDNDYTEKSITKTYIWDLGVHKYTNLGGEDTDHPLEKAEFKLYKGNGADKKYATFSTATTVDGTSIYKLTDWVEDETTATAVVTPASGNIKLKGLDAGTYYLEETKAPTGYNKLSAPIKVEINSTLPDAAGGTASYTVTYGDNAPAANGVVRVENKTGTTLPSTGGIGTTIFYVVGGGLMVAAIVLLVTKKRMENK